MTILTKRLCYFIPILQVKKLRHRNPVVMPEYEPRNLSPNAGFRTLNATSLSDAEQCKAISTLSNEH